GYTKGAGQKSNYLIVKFNPANCDTVWTRQYNYVFNQSDRATAVAVDASGNIYVTGRSDQDLNDTLDNNDAVTLKYSPTGVLQWTQRFNGTTNGRDEATDILIDNAGNVVVCGRTQSGLQDNAFVIKYNPATGTPVWAAPAIYAGSAGLDDRAEAMAVDANDNIFVAGKTVTSVAAGSDDALAFRVTSAGALSGVYTFNGAGSGNDEAAAIATDYQNKVVVLMRSDRDATPLFANYDYVTVKLENNLLTQTWAAPKVYDGPVSDDDEPVALAINSAGEILVTGFSSVDTTGGVTDNNIVSIRYDAWGVQDWISSWQGPAFGDDEPIGLLQQNTATWVCGISDSTVTYQSDAVLLRYDLATAVNEPSVNVSLLSAYPNPASDRVRIRYAQPVSGNDRLCLFDVSGRVVLERPVYFNEFDLDLKGIASGSYRLVISGQGQIQSAGLIVR
ncbi:MAG: hypothetical protein RL021_1359, partial [Bacteroidota bacterium]